MSYFLRNGNTYRVTDEAAMDLHKILPVGNYIIKESVTGELYLEQVDGFTPPSRIYGNTIKTADRILNTFMDRTASTGVMLSGEKGSGKTLLAKMLSMISASKMDIPTIIINHPYHGDTFNKFMQDIEQPCIVLFDEFEKVYDRDQQESILTLLDGVFPSKKLFVITCNDKWRIDSHMRNRPGRIFYMMEFKGLEHAFVREYCEDNLKDLKHIDNVCKISTLFSEFNFDMLKALVEEMNRYDETPQEAMTMLNAKPEFSDDARYDVALFIDKKQIESRYFSPNKWNGNPLSGEISISFYGETDDDADDDGYENNDYVFVQTDLQKIEPQSGRFMFVNNKKVTAILTREKEKVVDYLGVL